MSKLSSPEDIDFGNWPLPTVILAELGRIAAAWNSLENLIDVTFAKLSGLEMKDPRALIIFAHMAVPQKLDIVGALADQLAPGHPNLTEMPKALSSVREAQRLRNQFMHGGIVVNETSGRLEMPVASARGKFKAEVRELGLSELKAAIVAISDAQRELYRVLVGRALPRPWEKG